MQTLIQDLRYGARVLAKKPGYTAVAVLTLALGIGVNSALFTVFDAFVLKPLPLKDPGSLVSLEGVDAQGHRQRLYSYLDYVDYGAENSVFSDLIAWNKVRVSLGETPLQQADSDAFAPGYEYLFGQLVSGNYFAALGAEMTLGRPFLANEDKQPGEHPVVVLSHSCWQQRFNADAQIIGRTIMLQGQSFTVVGVTAREFIGTTPDVPAFWVPLMMRDQLIPAGGWGHGHWRTERGTEVFTLLGRLKPGVTRAQAEVEMKLIAGRLAQSYPRETQKTGIRLERAGTFVTLDEDLMTLIVPLLIGFGLVLLMACANVANLLLACAAGRQREIGVRLALGASRGRIVRQLLTDSLLLALTGGAAGLLLAVWTLSALYPIVLSAVPLPEGLAAGFTLNIEPDWRVFGFTLLLAVVAGIAAGLAPALQASKPDLTSALKDEGSTFGPHLSQSRLRSGLVIAQIAVCLTLLIGAGLLVRNLRRVQTVDTGMTTKNVFSVAVGLSGTDKEQDAARIVVLRRLLAERLKAMPGVAAVSEAQQQPLSGRMGNTGVTLSGNQLRESRFNFVSSEYFETLGIRVQSGRAFTAQEVHAGAPVVVISEASARRFWPGANPIGQRLGIAAALKQAESEEPADERLAAASYPSYEVIGVARDTRSRWVWQQDETFLYVPLPPATRSNFYLLVRTAGEPPSVMNQVRELAATIDPALRVVAQRTEDHLAFQMAPFRALAWLSGALGMLALLLAGVGLAGVMSFLVTQRTREIGIRLALGARQEDVVKMFLWQGLRLTAVGIICGWLGGAMIAQLLAAVLIDLSPLDPVAFGGMAAFLLTIALLACWLPARRATKVDPLIALRYE